jgi:hypothetical protein
MLEKNMESIFMFIHEINYIENGQDFNFNPESALGMLQR